jgi:hypothetical protein
LIETSIFLFAFKNQLEQKRQQVVVNAWFHWHKTTENSGIERMRVNRSNTPQLY